MTTKIKHVANNVITDSQIDLSTIDTGEISEGSNLYFTNARVDSRLSGGSLGAISHNQGYTQTAGTWQKQGTNGNITIASNGNEINFSRNAANYLNATGASASLNFLTNNQTALTLNSGQNAIFAGDVTITGQLSITGNIDQYNVTDLDITDQTITLGSGQIEANSGGSGIIVDGSNASLLWDEANDQWDFNKGITSSGTSQFTIGSGASVYFYRSAASDLRIALGSANAELSSATSINLKPNGTSVQKYKFTSDDFEINGPDLLVGTSSNVQSGKIRVNGKIVAGDASSPNGDVLLEGLYNNGATVVIGSERSSGGVFLGYGLQPSTSTQGQVLSSTPITLTQAAYVIADQHKWYTTVTGSAVTAGSQVTGTVEAMRLTNTGRLGIGTDSPAAALQVGKGISSGPPAAGASTASACFGNDTSDDNYGLVLGADGFGKGYISAQRTDGTAATYDLLIQPNGGNVGIGTTSPTRQLHLNNASDHGIMAITGGTSNLAGVVFGDTADDDVSGIIHNNSGDYLYFNTSSTERMRIRSDGNVGINVQSPTEKLEVDGGLKISNSNSRLYFGSEGGTSYRALEGNTSGSLLQVGEGYTTISLQGIAETTDNLKVDGRLQLIDGQNYIEADQTTATRMKFYLNNTIAGEWKRTGSGGSIRPNQYSSGNTAANLPALASYDDEDTGVFFPEANKVGFAAGGNNVFTVKSTGQIEARGEVTGTRIVSSVQNMFHVGAEKSEHDMLMGTGRTYVDGGSSNYQGYRFVNENWFPPVFIPYSPNQVYRISASMYQLQGSTASGGTTSRHYFGLAGYDENFNFIQADGIGTYQYILASNTSVTTGNFLEMDTTMKGWQGSGQTDGNKMDEGTVYIRPLVLFNYQNAGGQAILTGFTIMPAGTVADNDSNAGTNY